MALLAVLFYLTAVQRVIDVEYVRRLIQSTGPLAPVTYVVVSALLGAVLVPGPILAAGSGFLFGPHARDVRDAGRDGRHRGDRQPGGAAGRPGERPRGAWPAAPSASTRRSSAAGYGRWSVSGSCPGISDALASYAFGAFGVPLWQMAVGAFIGSVPRAFVYTALGASIGDLSAPLAYTAIAVWCLTAVIGAFAAHRGWRAWRSGKSE